MVFLETVDVSQFVKTMIISFEAQGETVASLLQYVKINLK